jgi:flavin reductase (DIM6/NTAB) family NADH-FMN oxidoreductase RutF
MSKIEVAPRTDLYPLPTALVSCEDNTGRRSIITISWTGICCSVPPMLSIAVRKNRYSHGIISESKLFGLNLPNDEQTSLMDYCGNNSGRNVDKFEVCKFTPVKGDKSGALLIEECPVSHECVVKHIIELGSHDLFVAEITATYIDKSVIDKDKNYLIEKLNPIAYIPKAREFRGGFTKKLGKYGEFKNYFNEK